MTSVKCPQCGLVYWSTAESCRRCGLLTEDMSTYQRESHIQQATTTGRHSQISNADAEQMLISLKKCSRLFYFIGGLQILAWFILGNLLIVDGVCNIGLSYVTYRFKSRIAATTLLLLTLLSVMVGLIAIAMGAIRFNLFVPLVLVWRLATSIRMVYITFKLNAYEEVDVTRMMPPLPPVFQKEDASQWSQPAVSQQWQPE